MTPRAEADALLLVMMTDPFSQPRAMTWKTRLASRPVVVRPAPDRQHRPGRRTRPPRAALIRITSDILTHTGHVTSLAMSADEQATAAEAWLRAHGFDHLRRQGDVAAAAARRVRGWRRLVPLGKDAQQPNGRRGRSRIVNGRGQASSLHCGRGHPARPQTRDHEQIAADGADRAPFGITIGTNAAG